VWKGGGFLTLNKWLHSHSKTQKAYSKAKAPKTTGAIVDEYV